MQGLKGALAFGTLSVIAAATADGKIPSESVAVAVRRDCRDCGDPGFGTRRIGLLLPQPSRPRLAAFNGLLGQRPRTRLD
jgi:hypothetical protein